MARAILELRAEQAAAARPCLLRRLCAHRHHGAARARTVHAAARRCLAARAGGAWTASASNCCRRRCASTRLARKRSPSKPWDWRYWAETGAPAASYAHRRRRRSSPTFALDRMVVQAAFDCAAALVRHCSFTALRGICRSTTPTCKAYEVRNATRRRCRRPSSCRTTSRAPSQAQWRVDEPAAAHKTPQRTALVALPLPVVLNNNNFAKSCAGCRPTSAVASRTRARCSMSSAMGLHGMLSDVTYERLSGTSVLKRLRRTAVAAVRALDHRARGAAPPRPPCR